MSLNTWTDVTCPSGCDTGITYVAIPALQNCVLAPKLSQVSDLYIKPTGAADAFTYGVGNPTLSSGNLDNTAGDNTKTIWVVGKGGIAEPETSVYEGAKGKSITTKRRYRLEFEVNVREESMYNLVRQFQCGDTAFTFRYGDRGDFLYGGPSGINPVFTDGILSKGAGDEDNQFGSIIIEFETTNGDPPRDINPHAS